jgi:two-component system OmpR family response regulator
MINLPNASASPHILIVEDDEDISALIARYLASHEIRASIAAHGQEMEWKLAQNRIDLIILDLNLPKEDGLSLCRRLRKNSSVPIIMLTARGEEVDRIVGLEMGADDYLVKPFSPRELVARIRAVLRRQGGSCERHFSRIFHFAGWQVDRGLRQVVNPNGVKIILTGAEFDLMVAFCENAGRVLSREQLLEVAQRDSANGNERSIDILVSRLRQKIEVNSREPEIIKTVRSGGYVLSQSVEAE